MLRIHCATYSGFTVRHPPDYAADQLKGFIDPIHVMRNIGEDGAFQPLTSTVPIGDQPLMKNVLARMMLSLEGSRALLYRTCALIDRNRSIRAFLERESPSDDERAKWEGIWERNDVRIRLLTPLAKYLATESCVEITRDAIQAHGGIGFMAGSEVGKLHNDAIITTIYEGTSEIQVSFALKEIGKGALGVVFDEAMRELAELGAPPYAANPERVRGGMQRILESAGALAKDARYALLSSQSLAEVVINAEDSFGLHIEDTLKAGAGLCREDVVRFVVSEGPERISELINWGVEFSRKTGTESTFDLGKEGGHSRRRVLHAADSTGKEIERALIDKVHSLENVRIYENFLAIDLIRESKVLGRKSLPREEQDRCLGAYVFDTENDRIYTFRSRFTILATGGAGKVYLITTNPDIATGDGIAMAWRAGCRIANMEFNQFHPTCLYHPQAKSFLVTEAVRGEGGLLKLPNGERFMHKFDARAELAPRDIVARAIDHEMKRLGSRSHPFSYRGR